MKMNKFYSGGVKLSLLIPWAYDKVLAFFIKVP